MNSQERMAAVGQEVPELPDSVLIGRDRRADRGPLEGLAVGLQLIADRSRAAFVTSCDVPLLVPEFVGRMVQLLSGYDVAVPHIDGLDEPLAAVYCTGVLPQVEELLATDQHSVPRCRGPRPAYLFDRVRTRRVTAEELSGVDPKLQSLRNVNSPPDYRAALAAAGLAPGRTLQ